MASPRSAAEAAFYGAALQCHHSFPLLLCLGFLTYSWHLWCSSHAGLSPPSYLSVYSLFLPFHAFHFRVALASSSRKAEMEQLVQKTKALNWGIPPPPSWKFPVEAATASGAVLVGRIIAQKHMPLHVVRGVLQKVWLFDPHLDVVELATNVFLVEFSSSSMWDRVLTKTAAECKRLSYGSPALATRVIVAGIKTSLLPCLGADPWSSHGSVKRTYGSTDWCGDW